jgi:hypothetical protein
MKFQEKVSLTISHDNLELEREFFTQVFGTVITSFFRGKIIFSHTEND